MNSGLATALFLSLQAYGLGALALARLSEARARAMASQIRARVFLLEDERAVMFVGTVAPAAGESAERDPVSVRVTQTAEAHAGHLSWKESARSTEARPFDVVCDDGRRVRVEPGAEPFVARALDRTDVLSESTRTRASVLRFGARAVVCGAPQRALVPSTAGAHARDGSALGLVLVAPPGEPLTIFEAHPEQAYLARAKAHARAALGPSIAGPALLLYFGAEMTEQAVTAVVAALLAAVLEHLWLLSRVRPWYLRERIDDVEPRRARLTRGSMLPK